MSIIKFKCWNLTNWVHDGASSSSVRFSASRTVLLAKEDTFDTLSLHLKAMDCHYLLTEVLPFCDNDWPMITVIFKNDTFDTSSTTSTVMTRTTWKRRQAWRRGVWPPWAQRLAAKVPTSTPRTSSGTTPQATFESLRKVDFLWKSFDNTSG